MILSPDNRCPICQTKTHPYKRDNIMFCSRCCRSFSTASGAWVRNWAWVPGPEGGAELVPALKDEAYAKVTGPKVLRQPTPKSRPSAHKGLSTDAWPPEKIEKLRELWLADVPVTEIGRQIRASKNAVVGKAHRMNLPPRESPIVRRVTPPAVKIKRVTSGSTLPPLQSEMT